MRDLDSLQPTCQAAQRLPYEMSQDLAPCDVACQSSRHRSAPASQNGEHSHHPYALSAPVGWPCPPHGQLPPSQKTTLRRAVHRHLALTWKIEAAL